MSKKIVSILSFAAILIPVVAEAGTANASLDVSTLVSNSCTITAAPLSFAGYDPVSGLAVDGQADLTVACTQGSTNTITLGQGANAAVGSTDTAPLRQMANGADVLGYTLYQDSARTTAWGNTTPTGVGYSPVTSAASTVTVYGTINSNQPAVAGSYSDTVLATISF